MLVLSMVLTNELACYDSLESCDLQQYCQGFVIEISASWHAFSGFRSQFFEVIFIYGIDLAYKQWLTICLWCDPSPDKFSFLNYFSSL
jgi:hypothetical protein